MEMSAYGKTQLPSMNGFEAAARYPDTGYDQYQPQTFANQPSDRFAQLNQHAFAANNAVEQYVSTSVLECEPSSGMFGTKIFLRFSSTYDFFSMTSPSMPYVSVLFGSQKCAASAVTRESQDSNGFVYSCTADAPQLLVTGCPDGNVPLSLVLESASGENISRTVAGTFQYLDGARGEEDITRADKMPKHDTQPAAPPLDQPSASPKDTTNNLLPEAATNSYDYQSATAPQQSQYGNAFSQGTNDMITTYRSSSFTDPHYRSRRVASGWHGGYGSTLGSTGRGSLDHGVGMGRHGMTTLPMPSSSGSGSGGMAPQLVRTSTIPNGANSGGYHPMSLYSSKAVLKISGKLDSMTHGWTDEEYGNKRRLVLFRKTQEGSTVNATFKPVSPSERPPGSICISCIWWEEKKECFVTSVDTIYLLEQLVQAPRKFSVEEKNRIRRNLEGFHPLTVSKAKADSEEFFKVIMGFPNPKPRNIEKDVKVFPWKILEQALKKIIGKYSASPSSSLPPANIMTSMGTVGYAPLPTPPGLGMSQHSLPSQHPGDPYSHTTVSAGGHDAIPSPRSLSGSGPSWTPYTTATTTTATSHTTAPAYASASRTVSPQSHSHLRQHQSPHQATMRIHSNNPLPSVNSYDTGRTVSTAGAYGTAGLHTPISHHQHHQHSHGHGTPPRWDAPASAYGDGYSSLSGAHHHGGQPVYTASAYDGAPRA